MESGDPDNRVLWTARRDRIASRLPRPAMDREAVDWLARARGRPWAVACSGGLDSVALALLAEAWFRPREGATVLLHFNHGLRGAESDGDAAFVREMAAGLGCAYEAGRWEDAPGDPPEAECRRARWAFFEETCRRLGIDCVLLGHQLDDVAESLLMRAGRGSGTAGLAAPRSVSHAGSGPARVRPLLGLSRGDLEAAMREADVPWREDSTNESRRHTRNRMRLDVLPAWKAAVPQDWRRAVARTRRLCAEDADALAALAADLAQTAALDGGGLLRAPLEAAHRAVARRALERWLRGHDGLAEVSAAAVEAVVDAVLGTETTAVELGRWRVEAEADTVCVRAVPCAGGDATSAPPPRILSGDSPFTVEWPGGGVLRGERVDVAETLLARLERGEVDPRGEVFLAVPPAAAALVLRPWRAGDRYRPLGAPGTRKLKDAFADRGVPPERRRRLPVVTAADGTVLWAPGLLPAECARVLRGCPSALRLTYLDGSTPSG